MLSGEETGVMGPGEKGLEKFLIFFCGYVLQRVGDVGGWRDSQSWPLL